MRSLLHSLPGRALALLVAALLPWLGCDASPSLAPVSGVPAYQQGGLVPVPGGVVNGAGGNLLVERLDLSLDTVMGLHEIRAVYNAASGDWRWSFQTSFDGAVFVDPTGAAYDVTGLSDGETLPGSVWVKGGADRIETKGGLVRHFDAAGRLDHVAWRGADHPRIQYAWSATRLEISSCTQPATCQPFVEVALDGAGRPLSVTDLRTGRVARFGWDALGRLESARSPQDVAGGRPGFRYEYATGGTLLTAVTNTEGERIEYAYQAGRRIHRVTQVGEESPTHVFSFGGGNAEGFYRTTHISPVGAETRLVFDRARRLHRVRLVDSGEVLDQEWSGKRLVRRTLPGGVVTELEWEGQDVVELRQPSGNVVRFEYEPGALHPEDVYARPIRRVEDSLGLIEERSYDALGRPVTLRNGEGDETAVVYQNGVTPASIAEPTGVVHGFPLYGIHGRWLERTGAAPDERAFDAVGNAMVPASLERGGGILSRGWDADRRLASLVVAAGEDGRVTDQGVVSIVRRSDGRPLAIARPGGGDHEFVYDAVGRLVERRERVDGAWQATLFEYDAAGRRTARTRPNGMREEWDYDGYGRLVRHRALRYGVLEGEAQLVWAGGRLVSFFDALRGTAEVYGYDAAGRRDAVWFGYGETLDLEWDLRSRLAAEVFSLPGQGAIRRIDYAYDLADRRVALRADAGEDLVEHTWVQGRRVSTRYGNGLIRNLAYDPETGLPIGATTVDAFGATLETTTVERTVEAGPPRSQLSVSTETPLASTSEEYWIGLGTSPADPDQRVGKRVFGWRNGQGESLAFAYDLLGNPADDADGDLFTTNAEGNRLLSAALVREGVTLDYSWDAAGFATSRAGTVIEWTATGRLSSHGATAIEWDMRGRPISWTEGAVTRDFSLFGGRVDRDPDSGALGALDLGEVVVSFGPERRYRHGDFRGNVRCVSDESGAIVSHYTYSPYGLDAVFGQDDGVAFVGRPSLGALSWLGARIYDPAVGRFLSPDPVFRLVNPYAYVMGNPVWFSDPDGTQEGVTGGDVAVAALNLILAVAGIFAIGVGASAFAVVIAVLSFYLAALAFAFVFTAWADNRGTAGPKAAESPAGAGDFSHLSTQFVAAAQPVPAGCAPTQLGRVPDLGWLLYWLLPLQLAAGVVWLRRRRLGPSRRRAA